MEKQHRRVSSRRGHHRRAFIGGKSELREQEERKSALLKLVISFRLFALLYEDPNEAKNQFFNHHEQHQARNGGPTRTSGLVPSSRASVSNFRVPALECLRSIFKCTRILGRSRRSLMTQRSNPPGCTGPSLVTTRMLGTRCGVRLS